MDNYLEITNQSIPLRVDSNLTNLDKKANGGTHNTTVLTNNNLSSDFSFNEGDVAINGDLAREDFAVDGSGITIGVISDSYDNDNPFDWIDLMTDANDDIASGDLPGSGNPFGRTTPVRVLSDSAPGKDEGRAMMQLIHDVAPGANLLFHTGFESQEDFAQGIIELANAGADIIVDDVFYYEQPFFQDSVISQAIDRVVARGVTYFSAAGNQGRQSYESGFTPSGQFLDSTRHQFHDFKPGAGVDTLQSITIPQNQEAIISFQWDSPFHSVSGGRGSQNDLNIYLYDRFGREILVSSETRNIGGDALEVLSFYNDGSYGGNQFNLAITLAQGAQPDLMKYIYFGEGRINQYDTKSGTVYGHANAAGAIAVGAANYLDTPSFGASRPRLESFSSAGNTPILFNTNGTRKNTPEIRSKPSIVAPDGVNTTFFHPDVDQEDDGLPNFFGTSAAAPIAAAAAALILESQGGERSLTPAQISEILERTAIDMDDPSTPGFDVGRDEATGFGLIDVYEAIATLEDENVTPSISISDATVLEGNSGTTTAQFTVSLSDSSSDPVSVRYATSNGTAEANDYSTTRGTLTFNPGQTRKIITVTVGGDRVVEGNETFFVNLTLPTNSTLDDSQGKGTINNDDSFTPNISIRDARLAEGNHGRKTARFVVNLSGESDRSVTVNYGTNPGSATNTNDYVATRGALTFRPGETQKIVTVPVVGERVFEGNENFFVKLTNARGANLSDRQGKGIINNDDPNPRNIRRNQAATHSQLDPITGSHGQSLVTPETDSLFSDSLSPQEHLSLTDLQSIRNTIDSNLSEIQSTSLGSVAQFLEFGKQTLDLISPTTAFNLNSDY